MKIRNWFIIYILTSLPLLVLIAVLTIYVDPYFHYHKPHVDKFFYKLTADDERYVNDGMIKHFDYDSIMTGTSMMENTNASEFNALFNCNSIKVPYRGGTFYEIASNIENAFQRQRIRYVFRSLDYYMLSAPSNAKRSHFSYPEYLYNNNLIDDVKYIWNANALFSIFKGLVEKKNNGSGITSFDEYANWMSEFSFGKDKVLDGRKYFSSPVTSIKISEEDEKRVRDNIQKNITGPALLHPETQFYYFLPPYSIAEWGRIKENGLLEKTLREESIAVELCVQVDNIHLYSFNSRKDWILNLNNYKDYGHYNEQINSEMLALMKNEEFRITKENASEYLKAEEDFFMNFDYNSIF